MPKILKKNTAILQVPEKVINDKNKLINSTTNKGDLKKDTIKIQIGKTLKIVSKGTSIEQQKEPKPKLTTVAPKSKIKKETKPKLTTIEPEMYRYTRHEWQHFPIIIQPLTEKELKKFNNKKFGYVDSVEKFNSLNFNDKFNIEKNIERNKEILSNSRDNYVEGFLYNEQEYYFKNKTRLNEGKREFKNNFNDNISHYREKETKSNYLLHIENNMGDSVLEEYRFIF